MVIIHTNMYMYIYLSLSLSIYIYIYIYYIVYGLRRLPRGRLPLVESVASLYIREFSNLFVNSRVCIFGSSAGFTKGGFSKGGFSNLCVIIMFVILNPPLVNPLCELPIYIGHSDIFFRTFPIQVVKGLAHCSIEELNAHIEVQWSRPTPPPYQLANSPTQGASYPQRF